MNIHPLIAWKNRAGLFLS
uniref:Uncharacterized protein n=1 Tax=Anguilla anguilla TaxID=7936 RepID=A0A0E9S9F8_ANGAN